MSFVLENLEPKSVFKYFEEICNIPHGSGNIDAISDYLKQFAEERGLFVIQDEAKNIIIRKEATPGYENEEGIIIQGHMDMVAVHKPELNIDMKTEPLKLKVEGDTVYAEGTSLGGDDGIAVAYALAILDDDTIPHPLLEVLITTEEETGMDGAKAVDLSVFKSHQMLNLDSEEEGIFLAGCAGGCRLHIERPVSFEEAEGTLVEYRLAGMMGGHSGDAIDKERGNALQLAGMLLQAVCDVTEDKAKLVSFEGGLADNAIPREASFSVLVPEEKKEQVLARAEEFLSKLRISLVGKDTEPFLETKCTEKVRKNAVVACDTTLLGNMIHAFPNGVSAMSADMPGLVQTSSNIGIIKLTEDSMVVTVSLRSSLEGEIDRLIGKFRAVTALCGAEMGTYNRYPAWIYKRESAFRDECVKVYEELTGITPKVEVIHAGLECGLFSSKRPDLDCISLGPAMESIHTTEEKLYISSVERTWKFILAVLAHKKA